MKNKLSKYLSKFIAILGLTRFYNLFFYALALYFTALFVFHSTSSKIELLLNPKLHFLVLASISAIASAYLINFYYDEEKDLINKPNRSIIYKQINTENVLRIYLSLSFISCFFSILISLKALVFFFIYMFFIWFYSHKIKKIWWINNLFSSILALIPFLALVIFYNIYRPYFILHAFYLLFILMLIEFSKDMINQKGDIIYNYPTIATKLGKHYSKIALSFTNILAVITGFIILSEHKTGNMAYYFYFSIALISFTFYLILLKPNPLKIKILHLIYKLLLILGVLALPLIVF